MAVYCDPTYFDSLQDQFFFNFLAMRVMYIFSLRVSIFCLVFLLLFLLYTAIFPQETHLHIGSAQNMFF